MKFEDVSHARDITFKKLLSRFSTGGDFLADNKKLRKEKIKVKELYLRRANGRHGTGLMRQIMRTEFIIIPWQTTRRRNNFRGTTRLVFARRYSKNRARFSHDRTYDTKSNANQRFNK